jgi:hypothetical protein
MARKKAWMAAKLAIMARQRKFTPHNTINRAGHTIEAGRAKAADLSTFKGQMVKCEAGAYEPPMGKGKRRFDGRVHGNGQRRVVTASDYYGLWSTENVLITT